MGNSKNLIMVAMPKSLKKKIGDLKVHPTEAYYAVIERLIEKKEAEQK